MNFTGESKTKCFWTGRDFCLMMTLSVVLLLPFAKVGLAAGNENIQHFKMLSTVEYAGKSQFRNQAETLFTVRKQPLDGDKVRYFLLPRGLSFVIDRKTRHLSVASKDLTLLERVNNQCVKSLKKVAKEDIGKSWKQSFNLSSLGKSFPDELKFTLTAIRVETKEFGEMMAVRALSEPFVVKAPKKGGGTGFIKSKIRAVYVFDPEIEDIYLSISVFEATTNINGPREKLRHEVATYMSDAAGSSVKLDLGKKFAKFVQKVGLAKKSLKIVNELPSLPQWAQSEGLSAAHIANICAATACEGALNPVATIFVPAAQTVAMQSGLPSSGAIGAAVSSALVTSVPGMAGMQIAAAPAFLGVGVGTAAAVAGGTVGTVAVAGGMGGGGAGGVTPASP